MASLRDRRTGAVQNMTHGSARTFPAHAGLSRTSRNIANYKLYRSNLAFVGTCVTVEFQRRAPVGRPAGPATRAPPGLLVRHSSHQTTTERSSTPHPSAERPFRTNHFAATVLAEMGGPRAGMPYPDIPVPSTKFRQIMHIPMNQDIPAAHSCISARYRRTHVIMIPCRSRPFGWPSPGAESLSY